MGKVEGNQEPEVEMEIAKGNKYVSEDQQDPHHRDNEMVKVNMYDNDWYEHNSDSEQMFTIHPWPKQPIVGMEDRISMVTPEPDMKSGHKKEVKLQKVKPQMTGPAHLRPVVKPEDRECQA